MVPLVDIDTVLGLEAGADLRQHHLGIGRAAVVVSILLVIRNRQNLVDCHRYSFRLETLRLEKMSPACQAQSPSARIAASIPKTPSAFRPNREDSLRFGARTKVVFASAAFDRLRWFVTFWPKTEEWPTSFRPGPCACACAAGPCLFPRLSL